MFKASNLKSFALGAGLAIAALGVYALAATLTTFKSGDVVSSSKINENFANLNADITTLSSGKQARVSGTCAEGSSIRVIAADGTVTCQTDNGGAGSPFQFGATLNGSDGTKKGLTVTHTVATAFEGTGNIGVVGKTTGADVDGVGVHAIATNAAAFALVADGAGGTGVAGEFNGVVNVSGNLNVRGKFSKKFSSTSSTFSQATPIAYGSVNFDGGIAGGTPNFTATRTAEGVYNVVIQGETYAFGTHMVTVTPVGQRMISVATGTGGGFKLSTFDSGFNPSDIGFTFVVYKP